MKLLWRWFIFSLGFLNRKYTVISSQEQRQSYKNDFNTEYSEYRGLHARIESITRQFTILDSELKQLQQGTDKYKVSSYWKSSASIHAHDYNFLIFY